MSYALHVEHDSPARRYAEAREAEHASRRELIDAAAQLGGYEALMLLEITLTRELQHELRDKAKAYPAVVRLDTWRRFKSGTR